MAPVLRQRKAAEPAPAPIPKKVSKVTKVAAKVKEAVKGRSAKPAKPAAAANGVAKADNKQSPPAKGDVIILEGFGGEIENNEGAKTTLKDLVEASKSGVVLFTYPKASTPGCELLPAVPAS